MSVGVRVTQLVPDSVEIQIHDVPIWVQDDVIIESLGVYGSAVGPLHHGFVKTKSLPLVSASPHSLFAPTCRFRRM